MKPSGRTKKGKEEDQGLIVLATRKLRVSNRTLVLRLKRTAARRPRRRGLRRGRGAQGRVRRLLGGGRQQPALQVQDPGAVVRPSAGGGVLEPRAHAGRC